MLLEIIAASMLGSALTGRKVIRSGEGTIKASESTFRVGEGPIRAGENF